MDKDDTVLVQWSLRLLPNGTLATDIENVNVEDFLKTCKELDPDAEAPYLVAAVMRFVLNYLQGLDEDLDQHLKVI